LRLKYNSPVILSYALLCCFVFFFDKLSGNHFMQLFTLYNDTNFFNPVSLFRLVSHIAGHVSLEHLMGNMTFILLLGPIVEERYGSTATLVMILATAVITAIINIIFFSSGLIGASGIVFMLIVLASFTNVSSGQIPLTFILVAILFVGKEIINSVWQDQVSQFAHIIGGACGSVFGFMGKKSFTKLR
jgi:membrane associated rhomboid family serine protease